MGKYQFNYIDSFDRPEFGEESYTCLLHDGDTINVNASDLHDWMMKEGYCDLQEDPDGGAGRPAWLRSRISIDDIISDYPDILTEAINSYLREVIFTKKSLTKKTK